MRGTSRRGSRSSQRERRLWTALVAASEIVLAIGAATAVVAAMQPVTPPAGLGVVYLLAVLAIAVRRGELAALAGAALGVLTLNFLFVAPRYQLSIAHTQDLVQLAVFAVVAVVVGRLATRERLRLLEGERRASLAARGEREADLLAQASSAVLAGGDVGDQLARIEAVLAAADGPDRVRLIAGAAPAPSERELVSRLGTGDPVWLCVSADAGWDRAQLDRVALPLGRLVDIARARERAAEQAAEVEAARRAETARTALLQAISHDLRSPLTAITTAASGLRWDRVTPAERAELIEVIDAEAIRLAKLIDDLLDLSMIEAGAVRPRSDWCDLRDVVALAAADLDSPDRIELALPTELPLIRADAAQLERVFANLLENGIKFSPPGATVRVSGAAAGGRVIVRVMDRGSGIPLHERRRVFEPFFRGRSGSGAGSGLGLAICRGFVEANDGRIVLQADSGSGTSFAVSFPAVAQPEFAPAARR